MLLGPSASVVAETSAPFLWTLHASADGTLWAGSGNEGKLLRIRDGKVTTHFDAGELEVHAVAPAPDGGLYVGTSPDGRIYHVAGNGTSRTFFDPDDKYIWSLATDRAGNLFAATGDKGVIYKITPDGKGAPFYRTNTTNVVSLAFSRSGELLAGTEAPGRVFRIDASGKAFVLLDSPFREIHALKVATDGTIYAAAVNGGAGSPARAGAGGIRAAASTGRIRLRRNHRRVADRGADSRRPATVHAASAAPRPAVARFIGSCPMASGTCCGIPARTPRSI